MLFVLGIQRSGTTWVANMFDASPDTLLFMEPFAPAYGLFPEMPDQGFFLQSAPAQTQVQLAEHLHERLYRRKYLFLASSLTDPNLFRIERALVRFVTVLARYMPSHLQRRGAQFTLLNLNRFERSYPLNPKSEDPRYWIVKELRVAGQMRLLQATFARARYLAIIRSPHATVHSMLRWFSRGRLGELRQELSTFLEKLEAQNIGNDYKKLIVTAKAGSISHRAALYWRVCYETMVRELENNPRFRLVPYEAIADQATTTMSELYDWAEIPWSDAVRRYIGYSTDTDTERPTVTNTIRKSASHYWSWRHQISSDEREAVDEIVEGSFLLDVIRPFYEEKSIRFEDR